MYSFRAVGTPVATQLLVRFGSLAIPGTLDHDGRTYVGAVLRRCLNADQDDCQSALDHNRRGFGGHAGVGVQHAKPVLTRLPQLDINGELARLVGLRG